VRASSPPAGRRRAVIVALFCLAAFVALAAPAASAPPKEAGPPSFEERLSAFAERLYAAAQRRIVAPARREAAAALADPRAAQIYRSLRQALRRFRESAESRALEPAAERLSRFFGNARQAIEGWLERELFNPFGSRAPAGQQTAGAAIEAAVPPPMRLAVGLPPPSLPEGDLLKNLNGDDPFEPVNRTIFNMNNDLRLGLFDPVTTFYLAHTTQAVQASVRNFFGNLHEPVTVIASALEGRFGDAGVAAERFGINSTLGVGGLFDPAARFGLTVKQRDLEQALCILGLPAGPYLVLPILGPATLRDAAGRLATVAAYFEVMGPYIYVPYRLSDLALRYSEVRDRVNFINSLSLDPYVAQRALYLTLRDLGCGKQEALDKEFFAK
jgi:phospholipid-binding lipoprotein MlaA